MALELDELLSRLTRLNQQKIESTEKMALIQDEIMHLKDMIVEREERHTTEASTLATVIEEIEVGVRLTARQRALAHDQHQILVGRRQSNKGGSSLKGSSDTNPLPSDTPFRPGMVTRATALHSSSETPTHVTDTRSTDTSENSPSKRWPAPNLDFPMIVELDDELMAIACGICKANAVPGHPGNPPSNFFNGMRGLIFHMVGGHGIEGVTLDEVAVQCHRTLLSKSDAHLVRSGQAPRMKIEMVTMADNDTIDVRSKDTSNAGFEPDEAPKKTPKELHAASVLKALSDPVWPSLHINYPTVVRISGETFSIACHICGANAKTTSSRSDHTLFMAGVAGLLHHIGRCHPECGRMNKQAIVNLCQRTRISPADARRIEAGQAPLAQIDMVKLQKTDRTNAMVLEHMDDEEIKDSSSWRALSPAVDNGSPSRFHSISDEFPTVVLGDNAWESIRCHLCGANALCHRSRLARYMRGILGLAAHYRQSHPGHQSWNKEEVYSACERERVDPKVADAMLAGRDIAAVMDMDFGSDAVQLENKSHSDDFNQQVASEKPHLNSGYVNQTPLEDSDEFRFRHMDAGGTTIGLAEQAPKPPGHRDAPASLHSESDHTAPEALAAFRDKLAPVVRSLQERRASFDADARPKPRLSSLPAGPGKRSRPTSVDDDSSSDTDRPLKQHQKNVVRVESKGGAFRRSI